MRRARILASAALFVVLIPGGAAHASEVVAVTDYFGGGKPEVAPIAPEATDFALDETGVALLGSSLSVADSPALYIDNAIVGNQLRLRMDAAYNNVMPDRAEFFYGQCGCFGGRAPGPPNPETSVDYQDIAVYLEQLVTPNLSAFIELPVRAINPEQNENHAGVGDLNSGVKLSLLSCDDRWLTFQFRVYIPSGDGDAGLGTEHFSLEPALLYQQNLTSRLSVFGELRDWIPLSDSEFQGREFDGNILRWGIGSGYDLWQDCSPCGVRRLTAVTELVGWSVLGGQKFDGRAFLANRPAVFDADGDEIVNMKAGLRYTAANGNSLSAGYGAALTEDAWYEEILRLEYRLVY